MRKEKEISETYDEFQEKIWWSRHRILVAKKTDLPEEALENAKRIEAKYGIENLPANDYEIVLMEGRMSALFWAMGNEWEGSLDT